MMTEVKKRYSVPKGWSKVVPVMGPSHQPMEPELKQKLELAISGMPKRKPTENYAVKGGKFVPLRKSKT